MKAINLTAWIMVFPVLMQCGRPVEPADTAELMGVQAVYWTQFSSEADALFYQGYNIAGDRLMEALEKKHDRPLAVTLDLDETVLDNSPFSVRMLREGSGFSEENWNAWCREEIAGALPGALGFTRFASENGVEVFYVSNRSQETLGATVGNLRKLGFPRADSAHVLLKTTTSSKDARREQIGRDYHIVLLLGDNLGDFDGLFDVRSENRAKMSTERFRDAFGRRFIVFPNPMYGSWENEVFPDGLPGEKEVLGILKDR